MLASISEKSLQPFFPRARTHFSGSRCSRVPTDAVDVNRHRPIDCATRLLSREGSSHKSSWSAMTGEMLGGLYRNDEATRSRARRVNTQAPTIRNCSGSHRTSVSRGGQHLRKRLLPRPTWLEIPRLAGLGAWVLGLTAQPGACTPGRAEMNGATHDHEAEFGAVGSPAGVVFRPASLDTKVTRKSPNSSSRIPNANPRAIDPANLNMTE
jgi:hypothetical protein